ncbi:uncharacterized protein BP5553_02371 [Venustampulla echinocandica]|uniref:Protein artemis n=1 Tax=Venustampulla echinocandica TaxID=2656787 RepID=A0A370U3P7_9HELO|nr:uncharacterized protein BP5553_02371 [Venustampulla echinocandica]RDL42392.1 hypothetical protein BP5553_02371 [Venustampulla echinocandica]
MSTFGGVMVEFPDIRVDYFRQIPNRRPPLACFLSHVHSDHLAGLENFKSPFIYCSTATRELLLRLERYPHRLNFALGILESRKQQYKHLKNLLKPIPLETPTRIELNPGNEIQVTLFDANHCTGAVMFLFEDNDRAVLYTGDIRSEPWFVNSLTRNPLLIEYTTGLKTLDCIYLDTSNLDDKVFPTKADGLKELLQKVSEYPKDVTFYFSAWTFGYEEVWMALCRALKSQIHVDKYKMKLYQSIGGDALDASPCGTFLPHDGPVLAGYKCGNTPQPGCLTTDQSARIHSCEKGMKCSAINDKTIWIRPIVTRSKNKTEIAEVGVGGGGGDLTQRPELELDNDSILDQLLNLFKAIEDPIVADIKNMLLTGLRSKGRAISLDDMGLGNEEDELSLVDLAKVIVKSVSEKRHSTLAHAIDENGRDHTLPRVITFPYSRHSSYPELCSLVKVFRPKDVYPCTVDEDNWHEGLSIRSLFGRECSATIFRHDLEMQGIQAKRAAQLISQQTYIPESLQSSWPDDSASASLSSHCQNLRRKAISDGLTGGRLKRSRLELDGFSSSQPESESAPAKELENATPVGPVGQLPIAPASLWNPSSHANNVNSTTIDDNGVNVSSRPSSRAAFSAFRNDDGTEIEYGSPALSWDHDYMDNGTFFDAMDEVLRCRLCGYELWSNAIGFCTGCQSGQSGIPYFEIQEPDAHAPPHLELNGFLEDGLEDDDAHGQELFASYLDCHSSAYDSQDESADFAECYEVNSFIDDGPQVDAEDDEGSSSDGESIYKEKYPILESAHEKLARDHLKLNQQYNDIGSKYDDLQSKLLGSDYPSNSELDELDGLDELDEDGMHVVDVTIHQPVLTEVVVLSQAQDESLGSPIHGDQIQKAIEAAEEVDWAKTTLVSAQNNHTRAEVEL